MRYIGAESFYGSYIKQVAAPDGVQSEFALSFRVGSPNQLIVVYNGNLLEPGAGADYTISNGGETILFAVPPINASNVYWIFLGQQLAVPRTNGLEPKYETFVGDGSQDTFTLVNGPVNIAALIVFINSVLQRPSVDFTVSGNDILFSSPPSNLSVIDFYIHGVERSDIGLGTSHTPMEIDDHIDSVANPHNTTKTQVGLGNVTNDSQLKRSANDYSAFTSKTSPVLADRILIEDSEDSGLKKYCELQDIPVNFQNIITDPLKIKTHANFTGSESKTYTAGLVTSDNSAHTLASISVTANALGRFRIGISARREDGTDFYYWADFVGGVRRSASNSGDATLVAIPAPFTGDEGSPGYVASLDVSGSNLNIRVIGESGENVVWVAEVTYQEVLLST